VTGFLPGPDFDTYEHPTGQPDWWPSWLDVTIDDGPRPRRLQAVLSVLDKWGVKGTFFFIGVNVAEQWTRRPDETRKTVQGMLDSGHRVGYHTMCHDTTWANHLQSWTPEQIADDIALFDLTMSAMLGHDFTPVYGRLPGGMGRKYAHVRHGFRLGGLKAPVHWTIDDEVWSLATSKSEIRKLARKIVESRKPTVILVHEYLGLDRQLEAFFETVHEEMVKKASSNP
jgi:peptidoglycan/xylan/chitin deacetylase (PgdA/CDA1 family)